jgi:hypothetical protein
MTENDIRPGRWYEADVAVNEINGFWMYWVEGVETRENLTFVYYYAINFTYTSGDDGQDWVLGNFGHTWKLYEDRVDVFINYAKNLPFTMYCELPYEYHHALDWVRV